MKSKKSSKSDLEKKSVLFFQMGIVIALAATLVAFESGNAELNDGADIYCASGEMIEEIMTEITRPEPPKVKPPVYFEEIMVIKDTDPIIEDVSIDFTSEIGVGEGIDLSLWEPEPEDVEPLPFVKVEDMPEYMGGDENKFQKHLQSLVQYPPLAVEMGIQGLVYVNFVVDKKGKLTKANIVRSPDELLSNAVLKGLERTGTWKPGEQRKVKVPVTFTVPIFFKLQ